MRDAIIERDFSQFFLYIVIIGNSYGSFFAFGWCRCKEELKQFFIIEVKEFNLIQSFLCYKKKLVIKD